MIVAASLVTNIFSRWLMTILFMPFGPNAEDIVSENSLQASMKKAKELRMFKIEYREVTYTLREIHVNTFTTGSLIRIFFRPKKTLDLFFLELEFFKNVKNKPAIVRHFLYVGCKIWEPALKGTILIDVVCSRKYVIPTRWC